MTKKVQGCGTLVLVDTGDGSAFTTQGHCDAVTPWGESKAIVNAPTLDCELTDEVGSEEQSLLEFTQFWDPTDTDHNRLDTNFSESKTDPSKKEIAAQVVTPEIPDGAGGTDTVTFEAPCQIVSLGKESITPDGYWKRTVTLLRVGDITKTTA